MHIPQLEYEPLSDLLPVDELEERFELVQKFVKAMRKKEPGFLLSSASLIALYILPMNRWTGKDKRLQPWLGYMILAVEKAAYRCKYST